MNENTEQLGAALARLLDSLTAEMASAKDFVLAEAPEVIQQLLTYQVVRHVGVIVIIGGFVALIVYIVKRVHRFQDKMFGENEADDLVFAKGLASVVGLLLCLLGFVEVCFRVNSLLFVLIAPKVYILEYAADLIK